MTDIVERLRECLSAATSLELEAAEEIERLREMKTPYRDGFADGVQHERWRISYENERLRKNLEWLRASFRVNMLRAYPFMTHEEIDEKIKFVDGKEE